MASPNFFIVGVQKCGTSTLHYHLSKHPEIYLYNKKATYFFTNDFKKGKKWYEKKYFKTVEKEKAIGEATESYLSIPYAIKLIKYYYPKVKILVILRNPVDRAYSHWLMNIRKGFEKRSFEDAVIHCIQCIESGISFKNRAADPMTIQNLLKEYTLYIEDGHYGEKIDLVFSLFPRENVKIIFLEELIKDISHGMKDIFRFLEVDDTYQSHDIQVVNKYRISNIDLFYKIFGKGIINAIRRSLPPGIHSVLKSVFIRNREQEKPSMDRETEIFLTEYYKPHIAELEYLIGREITFWKRVME